jgi:2',3'-cyclic-nucleotide 2'-phosphodiesterase
LSDIGRLDILLQREQIKILFIADIIGKPGLDCIIKHLKKIKSDHDIGFCIANGENGAGGRGLTESLAREYFSLGIDVITSGNHIFEKANFLKFLNENNRILRPINYPPINSGRGSTIINLADDLKIGVINAQGRTFMFPIDCPFRRISEEINLIRKNASIIIVDFHAEATAEKIALAFYLDGKVSAVIGTHTHVQTADERILENGTAYITDVGMTGPVDSVIGLNKTIAIKRFIHQTPFKYQTAEGIAMFNGAVITINTSTGKAVKIERINIL